MNEIDKIYFINLERRPDRYEHFLKECSLKNVSYNKIIRYNAIDGLTYKFTEEEKSMFKNVDYKNQSYMNKIMGNQLSHYYILKEMVKNNYNYILICQDDVIFVDNIKEELDKLIKNIPKNTEIINIGFHQFASYNNFIPWDFNKSTDEMKKEDINSSVIKLTDTVNPCSLCYLVTQNGAINLINFFNRVGFLRATDWNYNNYLSSKNINYGTKKVLATGNPNMGSDIFN
jgi:GR25 family glycosyltransferase involved in LPS biosynthesis